MRRIEDYPLGEWLEAADTCQECDARYEVQLEALVDVDVATARVRAAHREDCVWAEADAASEQVTAGWRLAEAQMTLAGQVYQLLDWYLDIMACCGCERLVVGVPLLVFGPRGVLALCWSCAKQWGVMDLMTAGGEERGDA